MAGDYSTAISKGEIINVTERSEYPNTKPPSITKQGDGFRPTYIDQTGGLIQGDTVDFAELNYIFNDLYAKAAHIDQLLTAKGK
ncbi:hypothetical protein JMI76_002441 [Salmonella enterica]|nr:hypothetical protein [Salmonella enterica]